MFQSLLQPSKEMSKPFDCVGTANEAKAALVLTWWRYVKKCQSSRQPLTVSDTLKEVCKYAGVDCSDVEYWRSFADEAAVLSMYEL